GLDDAAGEAEGGAVGVVDLADEEAAEQGRGELVGGEGVVGTGEAGHGKDSTPRRRGTQGRREDGKALYAKARRGAKARRRTMGEEGLGISGAPMTAQASSGFERCWGARPWRRLRLLQGTRRAAPGGIGP